MLGWAVPLLPTVALQPCSASREAALGWGTMFCSHLWWPWFWLVRRRTRGEGLGFCRQMRVWKTGFALQSTAGQSRLRRLEPQGWCPSGSAKSELASGGALCFDTLGGRGTLGLFATSKNTDGSSVFILTCSVQNSLLYMEKCIWNHSLFLLQSYCCDTCVCKAKIFTSLEYNTINCWLSQIKWVERIYIIKRAGKNAQK